MCASLQGSAAPQARPDGGCDDADAEHACADDAKGLHGAARAAVRGRIREVDLGADEADATQECDGGAAACDREAERVAGAGSARVTAAGAGSTGAAGSAVAAGATGAGCAGRFSACSCWRTASKNVSTLGGVPSGNLVPGALEST
jgi:hypothetical protein